MGARTESDQSRRVRQLIRKGTFVALTVVLVCGLIEGIAFVATWVTDGRMFGYARVAGDIAAVSSGSEDPTQQEPRQPSTIEMVPHPYMGFVYPPTLNNSDFQNYHHHPVNAYGFVDSNPPIRARDDGRIIIGVLGASVAYWFSALGDEALIRELRKAPAFADKEIEIVRLALGSMKEPQQLMTLNWVLSLGGEFDVVINLDGYNEAMIPEPENYRSGMHPHFPRFWNVLMQGTPSHEFLALVGSVVKAKDDRRAWARTYEGSWMSKSVALAFVWRVRDHLLAATIARAQVALNQYVPPAQSYAAVGPGVSDYAAPLEREVVAYWRRCSQMLDQICTARGILYLHFLQPNQYLGNKPMSDQEKATALTGDHPLIPVLQRTYAAMIDAGTTMRGAGLRFHDLTKIFDSVQEPVYIDNCCHMNLLGNQIMATQVGQAIIDAWKNWNRPAARPADPVSRGIAGLGEVTPVLSLAEPRKDALRSWKLRVSRGRGAALGQLCVTAVPVADPVVAAKNPAASSLVTVIPVTLDGPRDLAGTGSALVDVTIPATTTSGTTTWYVRAVLTDPASRLGFSVSNSLTLTTP